jgi:hypothetical protein
MSTVKIEILHPASITLPKYVNTIGVVNRMIPRGVDMNNGSQDNSNCAFGDLLGFNKQVSDSCISSIFYYLRNSPRFKDVDIKDELVRDGNEFFPIAMDSQFVSEACERYNVDALIVLESFISQSGVSSTQRTSQVPYTTTYYINGVAQYRTQYRTVYTYVATLSLSYSIGFRIYGKDGSMLDEYRVDKDYSTSRTDNSYNFAMNRLPGRDYIIRMISNAIGDMYVHRISPMWQLEKRHYYTTPNKKFIAAEDSINANHWEGAKSIWLNVYQNGNEKQKSLSAFNLALAYEKQDTLETALEYANQSKILFEKRKKYDHIRTAKNYISTLTDRLTTRQRLMEQMK